MRTRVCRRCGKTVGLVVMPDGRQVEIDARSCSYGSIALDDDEVHAHFMTREEYGKRDSGIRRRFCKTGYEFHVGHCVETRPEAETPPVRTLGFKFIERPWREL